MTNLFTLRSDEIGWLGTKRASQRWRRRVALRRNRRRDQDRRSARQGIESGHLLPRSPDRFASAPSLPPRYSPDVLGPVAWECSAQGYETGTVEPSRRATRPPTSPRSRSGRGVAVLPRTGRHPGVMPESASSVVTRPLPVWVPGGPHDDARGWRERQWWWILVHPVRQHQCLCRADVTAGVVYPQRDSYSSRLRWWRRGFVAEVPR